jgi:hypothetical protein
MTTKLYLLRSLRILQIACLDIAVGVFSGLLVYEKTNRWPILLVVVPLLLFFNLRLVRRLGVSSDFDWGTLPLIYATGFVYGVLWTILKFAWWKLLIVPIPLILLAYIRGRKKASE